MYEYNIHRLTHETAIKEAQHKMREVEKTNDDLSSRLSKKERECESKIQENVNDDFVAYLSLTDFP